MKPCVHFIIYELFSPSKLNDALLEP